MSTNEVNDYPFFVGKYDVHMLDYVKSKMLTWKELERRRTPEFQAFGKFLDSCYLSLYKTNHIEAEEMSDMAGKIKYILDIAKTMEEWKDLKTKVENDHVKSALANMIIGEKIVIPEEEGGGGSQGKGGQDGEGGDEEDTGSPGSEEDQAAPINEEEVREAMREALQEANEVTDNAEALATLWGNEVGEDVSKSPDMLLKMAKALKNSPRMQIISKLLGRLRNQISRAQMSKSEYVPEEFVDITLGNDLSNLLPNSKMLLTHPDLETLFLLKYVQRGLLQQEKEGNERLAQGPIIVLVDLSGSMDAPLGDLPGIGKVTRADWAAAVALALTILARMQDREYYLAIFDARIRQEIRSRDISAAQVTNLLAVRGSGGTNFERPLQKGLDTLEQSEYNKADIVFITDGDCNVSSRFLEKFNKAKETKHFRVLGVSCGPRGSSIKKFSDTVVNVNNLVQADNASHKIFQIGE